MELRRNACIRKETHPRRRGYSGSLYSQFVRKVERVARIPICVRKWETADKILSEEIGDGSEKLAFADYPSVFLDCFLRLEIRTIFK